HRNDTGRAVAPSCDLHGGCVCLPYDGSWIVGHVRGGAMDQSYPVQVRSRLDEPLSRWLWLVKWLLAIPHLLVLFLLGIAFAVVTVIAFFAILFTARYPRGLFEFNLGVLRWSWRVGYYSYSALGTDRYPPFSLDEEPDYPATLDIAYPEPLSPPLGPLQWWLLALPPHAILLFLAARPRP